MIWTSTEKKDTKIVAVKEQIIYLCNPKATEIDNYVFDLNMNKIPQKDIMSIPFHYIKEINFYENKGLIEILFGSSTEEIFVSDPKQKEEIFNYFRENIPGLTYAVDSVSGISAAKKPLIALLVVIGLFVYSYSIANGFEHGYMYNVEGGHYDSIGGMVLVLASMGTKKLIIVFICLLAITLYSAYKKIKNPFVIRRLFR
jgi:hypothetical protein